MDHVSKAKYIEIANAFGQVRNVASDTTRLHELGHISDDDLKFFWETFDREKEYTQTIENKLRARSSTG